MCDDALKTSLNLDGHYTNPKGTFSDFESAILALDFNDKDTWEDIEERFIMITLNERLKK